MNGQEEKHHFIVEDDFDSEFFMPGKPVETLFMLDDSSSVIYINTFSKSFVTVHSYGIYDFAGETDGSVTKKLPADFPVPYRYWNSMRWQNLSIKDILNSI